MHLLPSALDGVVGVKVLGIQSAGSDVDVPLVQGSYLLMGGETLTPEVVRDAAALTEVRTLADLPYPWVESGSAAADEALGRTGLVVVATSAGNRWSSIGNCVLVRPCLLWGCTRWIRGSCMRMWGLRGAQVIVEDVGAARREAGDVAIAVEKGALAWDDVVTMAEVVRGEVALDPARRVGFKTVGMSWEDLAVARVIGKGYGPPREAS